MACLVYDPGRNCIHSEEVCKVEYKCLCSIDYTHRLFIFQYVCSGKQLVYLEVPGKVSQGFKLGLEA